MTRFSGTLWMAYAFGGGMALQGLYLLIAARVLKADGLGAYAGALALVSIAAPFSGWGSGNLLVMHTSRNREVYRDRLGQVVRLVAGTGAGFIVLYVVATLLFLRGTEFGTALIPLAVAELFFARISDACAQACQAHDELHASAHITTALSAARLIAALGFLMVDATPSPGTWSIAYLLASVAAAGASATYVIRRYGPPRLSARVSTADIRAGAHFSLGSASKTVYADIDKTMIARIASDSAAGAYTAAYRIVSFSFAPIQAFVYSSATRFYRDSSRGAAHMARVASRALPWIWGYALIAAALLFFAAPLSRPLLGSSFGDAPEMVRWLALMPLLQGSHYLVGDVLMAMGKQNLRSYAQIGTALVNVVINAILIPMHSWRGAVIASYVSEGLLLLLLAVILIRMRGQEEGASHA